MIPAYNCIAFLKETLESVMFQDPGAELMQIEVVDDASDDGDVCALVRETGKGRISYFRQQNNVGSLRNFQTCLERSRGHFVHILHGDDRVRKGFYTQMAKLFENYPSAGAAFCRYAYVNEMGIVAFQQDAEMDHAGVLDDWLPRICERQRIQYVAMVVRRGVYETVGGFYGVEYGEDWEMWARIAARYQVAYTPQVLAEYRRHYASVSGKAFVSGQNMTSLTWVMEQVQRHLPAHDRETVMRRSRIF
jgi:glycosyltransferase involved in cell wall biosynthesis